MSRFLHSVVGVVCVVALALVLPRGVAAGLLLWQADAAGTASEAAILADPKSVSTTRIEQEIRRALDDGDPDLAKSFIALADARNIALTGSLRKRVSDAVAAEADLPARAARFADGFLTGRVDDATSLAGTVAGDLSVFGDVRDLAREGWHYVSGAEVDTTMAALSGAGLALTAGTYATLGTAGFARAGLSAVKGIRRGARGGVTGAWLGRAIAKSGSADDGARIALSLARDAGRVNAKLGSRAAFDALKVSRSPQELARVARLADKRGMETRALLKLFGRGAIMLGGLAFNLATWLLWLVLALFGVLGWIKASTQRLTRALTRPRARARAAPVAMPLAAG